MKQLQLLMTFEAAQDDDDDDLLEFNYRWLPGQRVAPHPAVMFT